jgi:hypothetical protein
MPVYLKGTPLFPEQGLFYSESVLWVGGLGIKQEPEGKWMISAFTGDEPEWEPIDTLPDAESVQHLLDTITSNEEIVYGFTADRLVVITLFVSGYIKQENLSEGKVTEFNAMQWRINDVVIGGKPYAVLLDLNMPDGSIGLYDPHLFTFEETVD